MSLEYLPEGSRVTFELQGGLPVFREQYASPQAGTVVLKGLFNQSAHLELLDGTQYRTLSARRDKEQLNMIAYPLIRLPEKVEVCRLLAPIQLDKGRPQLRFTTTLDDQYYIFKQVSIGQRGFELWDSMEMQRLVQREPDRALIAALRILAPVPALLTLLFPWLDSQSIPFKR
jgi:hypothetical protein